MLNENLTEYVISSVVELTYLFEVLNSKRIALDPLGK